MGYRIIYGETTRWEQVSQQKSRTGSLTAAFLLLFCLLTATLHPEKWQIAKDLLIPGDPAVTRQACREFTRQLKDGEALDAAVVTFCRQVVDGADLSD